MARMEYHSNSLSPMRTGVRRCCWGPGQPRDHSARGDARAGARGAAGLGPADLQGAGTDSCQLLPMAMIKDRGSHADGRVLDARVKSTQVEGQLLIGVNMPAQHSAFGARPQSA